VHIHFVIIPLVLLFQAADPEPAFKLEVAKVRRIEAVLTSQVTAARYSADDWDLFAARAPQLIGQVEVSSKMEPAGAPHAELSPLHRPIFEARLDASADHLKKGFKAVVTYQATLRSRNLVALKPGERVPSIG
jgi:hypothetical protein